MSRKRNRVAVDVSQGSVQAYDKSGLSRWLLWLAMAVVGFGSSTIYLHNASPTTPEQPSHQDRSNTRLTALKIGDQNSAKKAINAVAATHAGSRSETIQGHLDLVQKTPTSGLTALLLESEKRFPTGDDPNSLFPTDEDDHPIGKLMRKAIIDRMLAEDPDGLLSLALSRKSDHVSHQLSPIMSEIMALRGYETVLAAADSSKYPRGATAVMEAVLKREILVGDTQLGWQRALAFGRLDLNDLFYASSGHEVVTAVIATESPHRLAEGSITDAFSQFHQENPDLAWQTAMSLPRTSERAAAMQGIGESYGIHALAEAVRMVNQLDSDQLRLRFVEAMPSMDPFGGFDLAASDLESFLQIESEFVRESLIDQQMRRSLPRASEEIWNWATLNGRLEQFERIETQLDTESDDDDDPFADLE